ncbi:NUDIX hydrolase [Agrobacterium tumefaciens]|uniref:NUDIX hydrolase n=1 Tax=Agrobacterium tumefaciens TaxID=358 RepID=UPI001574D7E0|nr:NUDIX hydrolase [Agrobacterium tumefaciens]
MAHENTELSPSTEFAAVADKLPKGDVRTQYAAICFRRVPSRDGAIEVLLITSRDSGRWVIPKGWPMGRKKPHQVACAEAWEEAGVRGRVHKKAWGHYTYVKKLDDGKLVPAMVQVHLLDVQELETDYPEKNERRLSWFTPAAAASSVKEPGLRGLISKLENYGFAGHASRSAL